jgi:hypothetical protein
MIESKDVVLLVIGTMVGFVTSIIANFVTPSMWDMLKQQRFLVIERNKSRALKRYRRLVTYRSEGGNPSPYLLSRLAILATFAVWTVPLTERFAAHAADYPDTDLFLVVLGLTLLVAVAIVLSMAWQILTFAEQWDEFEKYEAELKKKWGDDVIRSTSTPLS